jgi:hypothetical protein
VKCGTGKFMHVPNEEDHSQNLLVTLNISVLFSFLTLSDLSANYAGWCADVCCDYNTEETCYNPPSCALVGIKYSNLCPWCASSNSFPLTTCICLYKYHRLLMEAALVQQVKRGAAQVNYLC